MHSGIAAMDPRQHTSYLTLKRNNPIKLIVHHLNLLFQPRLQFFMVLNTSQISLRFLCPLA
jgi:hypothetical protein